MAKTETKPATSGIRVSQLAKELKMTSKALIEKASEIKITIKNASATLTRGQADRLRAKFGSGSALREEVQRKTRATKKKTTKKTTSTTTETGADVSAPEAEPEPEPEVQDFGDALLEQTAETPELPVEAAPVEIVAESTPAPAEPPAPAPVPETVEVEAPVEPGEPPREATVISAGPDIAPPIKRDAMPGTDARFGVVMTAEKAKEVHGPGELPPARRGSRSTEAKSNSEDFKPQVSYPSIPTNTPEEEVRRRGPGGATGPIGRSPGRRGPGRGMPGGRRGGGRHGRNLMQEEERYRSRRKARGGKPPAKTIVIPRTGPAEVTSPVTIKTMCEALGIKSALLIQKFFAEGKNVRINDILTNEDAELYAMEFDPKGFGITIKKARDVEEEELTKAEEADKPEDMESRAPVVTIMGHVDHGKTSLLDYIRSTQVAEGEAGGITQHIRAYRIGTSHGDLCFLDTPGHRAFTEMRARGANVTDIVVLVVAADDGVMPQTEEAISHAREAGKRIVVAINKSDLPEGNPDKIKGELAAKDVIVEDYGGDVGCLAVSAKTGQGIPELLERLALESELLELKANPKKNAIGTVIEAHKDESRGIVATLLVQEGMLEPGDVIICGHAYGSVRQLLNDKGRDIKQAGPSVPVLITGLNDVPLAGERFHVLKSIKAAANIAAKRALAMRQEGLVERQHVTLEGLKDMLDAGEVAALKLILKVDVMGSLVPLENAVRELTTDEAKVEIIHSAVGAVNETDVHLADASNAILIGFHVAADPGARRLADDRGVELRQYEVIYEVADDVKKALEGMLKPIEKEVIQGAVEIRQTFKISRIGTIAGCMVTSGTVNRNHSVRLIRDGEHIWKGRLASLKRVKDDVREVREGFECGVKLDGFDDIKLGDVVEAYTIEMVQRTLESAAKESAARENAAKENAAKESA